MNEFYAESPSQPLVLAHPPAPLRDGAVAVPPALTAPGGEEPDYAQPFGSARAISRVWRHVGRGPLVERARAELGAGFAPRFVFAHGDRVVAQGGGRWALLADDGALVTAGALGPGAMAIDAAGRAVWLVAPSSFLAARRLTDGKTELTVPIAGGQRFMRTLLAPVEHALVVASAEAPSSRPPRPGVASTIQRLELGAPPRLDADGLMENARTTATWHRDEQPLLMARDREGWIVAARDRLYRFDAALAVREVFAGSFTPARLSADESGRAYLIVTAGETRELWIVGAGGERVRRTLTFAPIAPPLVGPAHDVFVVGATAVAAFTPEGAPRWTRSLSGAAGAIALPDGRLLISEGATLITFDGQGAREQLHAAGEPLRTPPVVTAAGEVVVATAQRVLWLRSAPPQP